MAEATSWDSRLAPSPTGALHLGNARTFALNWFLTRRATGRLVLRVEDLEGPRKKPWTIAEAVEDLAWLGLDWDGELVHQSARHAEHEAALESLRARELVYPCVCTRRDVEAAQDAPHAGEDLLYPGTCRGRFSTPEEALAAAGERPIAWRARVPAGPRSFEDRYLGAITIDPSRVGGDFVVGKRHPDGRFAPGYQLAVTVDDALDGVAVVVRGEDLLSSTPRQDLLREWLDLPPMAHAHLPLVVGADHRRLAKRHGDTRLSAYRAARVPAARIRRWIEGTSGLPEGALDDPRSPAAGAFELGDLPRAAVVVPPHPVEEGPPPAITKPSDIPEPPKDSGP